MRTNNQGFLSESGFKLRPSRLVVNTTLRPDSVCAQAMTSQRARTIASPRGSECAITEVLALSARSSSAHAGEQTQPDTSAPAAAAQPTHTGPLPAQTSCTRLPPSLSSSAPAGPIRHVVDLRPGGSTIRRHPAYAAHRQLTRRQCRDKHGYSTLSKDRRAGTLCTTLTIPGGHHIDATRPAEFAAAVLRFLHH
jgi:hypothetical protein